MTAEQVPPVILTRHRRCPHKGGRDMIGAWRAKRRSPSSCPSCPTRFPAPSEQLTARVAGGPTARADDLACGTPRQMSRDRSHGRAAYAIKQRRRLRIEGTKQLRKSGRQASPEGRDRLMEPAASAAIRSPAYPMAELSVAGHEEGARRLKETRFEKMMPL